MGTAFSVLIRLELSAPGSQFLAGDHQLYNVIATSHGIIMIYFIVVPSIAGFGNYIAPVLVGAPDKNTNILHKSNPSLSPRGMVISGFQLLHMIFRVNATFHIFLLPSIWLSSYPGGYVRIINDQNACRISITSITGLTLIINIVAPRTPMLLLIG